MTDSEKVAEWVRWYKASLLKMNALRAIYENDPKMLQQVLQELGLASALDVIKVCGD